MKKKGTIIANGEIVPYIISGIFQEITFKPKFTYIRCNICRTNLYRKDTNVFVDKPLLFFCLNGHKKNCKYKIMNLDYKTHELTKIKTPSVFAENDFVDFRILDTKKVEQKLNVWRSLKGESLSWNFSTELSSPSLMQFNLNGKTRRGFLGSQTNSLLHQLIYKNQI